MHVDRGWLKEDHHAWSVHLEGVREGSAVADASSVSNQHQGDKVHRTVRRLLFATRARGAARDEQLGEQKTFLGASRWVYSRAATGRGAGRAGCPGLTHEAHSQDAEWNSCGNECRTALHQSMMTDSINSSMSASRACPLRPTRTQPDQGKTQRGQLRERPYRTHSQIEFRRDCSSGGRSGNTTIQSRRVHDRGKPSRAKPDERCRTPFAVQNFEAKTPSTRRSQRRAKVDHTWHGGMHDHADDKVANRALRSFTSTHSAWREWSLPPSGAGVSQTTRSA